MEGPLRIEVAAGPQRPELQHRLGPDQAPAGAGRFHPVADQVPARPFDDAGGDGIARREVAVILQDTFLDQPADTLDVSEYAAAFLFDANGAGVAPTLAGFRERYGVHFGDLSKLGHGGWLAKTTVPVGCFVSHRSVQEPTGTLDDLAPMVAKAWPERYSEASRLIDSNRHGEDKVSGSEAKRLKAIITVAGQFNCPGDPMSYIIGRDGLPRAQFEASLLSVELADFLTRAPWSVR